MQTASTVPALSMEVPFDGRRCVIPEGAITSALSIMEGVHVIHYLPIYIRPCFDQAFEQMFKDGYLASDIWFEDAEGDRHAFSDDRKREAFAEIRRYQPAKWAEIVSAAHSPLAA